MSRMIGRPSTLNWNIISAGIGDEPNYVLIQHDGQWHVEETWPLEHDVADGEIKEWNGDKGSMVLEDPVSPQVKPKTAHVSDYQRCISTFQHKLQWWSNLCYTLR